MDEATKQKLLEELRKEYRVELKPLPKEKLNINPIIDKYLDEICDRLDIVNDYSSEDAIRSTIRRTMCFSYGYWHLNEIPYDLYKSFKEDTEKFINEFILKKENYKC